MKPDQPTSRRRFLQTLAAVTGAPHFIPSSALGRDGASTPSGRVALDCIGVGNRGRDVLRAFLTRPEAQVVAVCDCSLAAREEAVKLTGGQAYGDYREVLARPDIDAVVIATPIHWHVPLAIAAAQAGKDVYLEEPLGLSIEQDLACRGVFRQTGRVFQYGTQQRSSRHMWQACELVRRGYIGQVKSLEVVAPDGPTGGSTTPQPVPAGLDYAMWLGPGPKRPYLPDLVKPPGHECVTGFGIGWIAAWGAHPLDIMIWGSDADQAGAMEFEAKGTIPKEGLFDTVVHWDVRIQMARGVTATLTTGQDSTKFIGTEGWVQVGRTSGITTHPESLIETKLEAEGTRLIRSQRHDQNFIEAVKNRKGAVTSVAEAVRSDAISHLSNIAVRLGRKIVWDPKQEAIRGDPEASQMLRSSRMPDHTEVKKPLNPREQ